MTHRLVQAPFLLRLLILPCWHEDAGHGGSGNFAGLVEMQNAPRLRDWPAVIASITAQPLTGAGFGRDAMKLRHPELLPLDVKGFRDTHNVFILLRNLSDDIFLCDVALLSWVMKGVFVGYGLRVQPRQRQAVE